MDELGDDLATSGSAPHGRVHGESRESERPGDSTAFAGPEGCFLRAVGADRGADVTRGREPSSSSENQNAVEG